MNVAELVATLVLDAAGFQSEIRKVDAAMTQTGQKASTMSDAVSQSVENSTNKAAQSFAKLAKTANSTLNAGLSQWNGAGSVRKAAQAVAEQAAILDKASLPEQRVGKGLGTLGSDLDRTQASIASRLSKWLGDAAPEASAAASAGASSSDAPMPTPGAVAKNERPAPSIWPDSTLNVGEVAAMVDAAPKTLAKSPTDPAAPALSDAPSDTRTLSSRDFASISADVMDGVAAAVSAALRHATEMVQGTVADITAETVAETPLAPPVKPVSSIKPIKPAENMSPALSQIPTELPERDAVPSAAISVANMRAPAFERAEFLQPVSPPIPQLLSAPGLPPVLPPILPENFSESIAAQVGVGATETAEAISAVAPQAAEFFARSGSQLAQSALRGLQKSVNAVLENFLLPAMPAGSLQTDSARSTVADTTEDSVQMPNASAFPASIYEPLAVTPPRAEAFAAAVGNTITSQTSISQITIHSQATDAEGIADDISGELERRNVGYQFDGAYSV